MNIGMIAKPLVLALAVLLSACATTSSEQGAGEDFGTIATNVVRAHVRTVRDHVRADRAALKASMAQLRDAFGYRGVVVERRLPAPESSAPRSDSGADPALAMRAAPYRYDRRGPAERPALHAIEMNVGLDEMLTPDGMLHPRAASALARMDTLAREHGGDFTVSVPRSQLQTVDAIRTVAPGATIVATDEYGYRLSVVASDR